MKVRKKSRWSPCLILVLYVAIPIFLLALGFCNSTVGSEGTLSADLPNFQDGTWTVVSSKPLTLEQWMNETEGMIWKWGYETMYVRYLADGQVLEGSAIRSHWRPQTDGEVYRGWGRKGMPRYHAVKTDSGWRTMPSESRFNTDFRIHDMRLATVRLQILMPPQSKPIAEAVLKNPYHPVHHKAPSPQVIPPVPPAQDPSRGKRQL